MFQQRLQQRLRFLVVAPAVLLLLVVLQTLTGAQRPGEQPREGIFDLFSRIHARPAVETPDVVVVDIDRESLERVGPWPWPRTALAGIVNGAKEAGAAGVVITVPVEGQDPLSPEVFARYWQRVDDAGEAVRALGQLPTNNAALAAVSATFPTVLGVGETPANRTGWARTDMTGIEWMSLATDSGNGFLSLPGAPLFDAVDAGFTETALVGVSSLPVDEDGVFRRASLLWSIAEAPAPAVSLAGLIVSGHKVSVIPSTGRLREGGPPPQTLVLDDQPIALDTESGIRLWLPQDTGLPSLPAWRVLEGDESWTQPLSGRIVFVGESVTPNAILRTPRGDMPTAMVQAQLAQQLSQGAVGHRPGWAGAAEALTALLFGVTAVAAAIFLRPLTVGALALGLSAVAAIGAFLCFQRLGLFIDPIPGMVGALGGPLAVLGAVMANMLVRDDAVRGAFHGALPASTMSKLQSRGGNTLLRGVRRPVTVLSCSLKLPPQVAKRFEGRPDDFIRFTASANDTLRRTILHHGGTVDFGEDGRLLGYWNVPEAVGDPIERACACALKMIDDVNVISENIQTAAFAGDATGDGADDGFADGNLEIGITCSPCFAGPVGRGSRNRYAVIGDAVRMACALRQRANQYGPAIITDDIVFDTLRHHYAFLDLDIVRTGPDEPVRNVYGLVGNPFLKASKAFRQLADTQRELVLAWRNGDLNAATIQLQRLRGIAGVPERYVDLYEQRIGEARAAGTEKAAIAEVIPL